MQQLHDAEVIIVGGGPAGLSAALILARACRSVIVFDDNHARNAAAQHLHGFLTRDGISPRELIEVARDDLAAYSNVRLVHATVGDARRVGDSFEVTLEGGSVATSRKLLIATGVRDNIPEVAGLREMLGVSVFHCPFCDAWEFRNSRIAVYGKGQRGFGLSLEMLGWSRDIVLCTDGPSGLDLAQIKSLTLNGIVVRQESIDRLTGEDGRIARVVFENDDWISCDALFFTTGQHQSSPLARSLGCDFNEKGTVRTGRHESTVIPGLYVAGDASRDVQWVIVAAAEGAEAAYAITQDLIREGLF